MSRRLHCTLCGALVVADRDVHLLMQRWRLCPRCRVPVPPGGVVPAHARQRPIPSLPGDPS